MEGAHGDCFEQWWFILWQVTPFGGVGDGIQDGAPSRVRVQLPQKSGLTMLDYG